MGEGLSNHISPQEKLDTRQTEPQPTVKKARRRVLLVEDNRDVSRALSRLIRLLGHEVRLAFDGEGALEAAAEYRPDIVLMDIGLPKLNGYDATRTMRAQPWGQEIYLVAVTGWGQADDRQRAYDAGFDEHLTKPVELETLREVLGRGSRRGTTASSP